MISAGTRVALIAVTAFVCFAAGQRITTIQLDGTQYYISRMNPYSAELNYFLAYEYCRSIGLQLASFETLEKTNSISDFLRNAGYNKFDYWTSGNRLGTDMLIWMSTGLPFNTTFSQMKRPTSDTSNHNGLDNDDVKLNARPELPIARKKRGESGSRDGCVAIQAPNMDWVTADCTDLKDFICEQTRCYYYNYGSIPVSSSQGFGYKQKHPPASLYSTAVFPEENSTSPISNIATNDTVNNTTVTTTTTTTAATTTTSFVSPITLEVTTTPTNSGGYAPPGGDHKPDDTPSAPEQEPESIDVTIADDSLAITTEQLQSFQEPQAEEQSTNERADGQYYTTVLPTLIQMHNQQQNEQQQQEHEQQQPEIPQQDEEQRRENNYQEQVQNQHKRNNAYAFESLEKAFATAVPHKIRSTKDLEQPKENAGREIEDPLPWSWAKDIMLQKPVLKKSSQEVV